MNIQCFLAIFLLVNLTNQYFSWFNNSSPLIDNNDTRIRHQSVLQSDGTYITSSYVHMSSDRWETNIVFQYSSSYLLRHDHGAVIKCRATNEVLEYNKKEPQEASHSLNVQFPPIVTSITEAVTINISKEVEMKNLHSQCLKSLKVDKFAPNY